MDADELTQQDLFAGLHALAESTFPRLCRTCGRVYESAEEFIAATRPVRTGKAGLKESVGEHGETVVDLFRNCACGSTMLESFYNRRDLSEAGIRRRQRFDDLLEKLVAAGIDPELARCELRKLVRNQPNNVIDLIRGVKGR